MSIFDSLISEAAQKFGLGDKAGGLLTGLLSLITNTEGGGLAGLVSKFTGAGLGDVVNSWIGGGESKAISGDQLSSVLGNDTVNNIAQQAGISPAAAAPALAFMLPQVVDKLTPGGVLPTGIPDVLKSYLGNIGDIAGKGVGAVGDLASGAAGLAGKGVGAVGDLASGAAGLAGAGAAAVGAGLAGAAGAGLSGAKAAADFAGDSAKSGLSWLWKVLPLLVILGLAYWAWQSCNTTPTQPVAVATPVPTVAATATPVPTPSGPLNPEAATKAANAAAQQALAALKAPFSADDLVKALNMEIINFASGSAVIPKDAESLLTEDAKFIKQLPAGTKLEVGGHTDNKGNAAGNEKLSASRASAVMAYLIKAGVDKAALTAKGYGPAKPVASNDTDEGRFKNRRIEFSVAK